MNKKCACLNVKFMPIEWADGKKEEQWMCLECKSIFVRKESAMCEANSNPVLADVQAIIDELHKKEIDNDIYSSKDLIKANRIDEYNNALNDVKKKISEHFS